MIKSLNHCKCQPPFTEEDLCVCQTLHNSYQRKTMHLFDIAELTVGIHSTPPGQVKDGGNGEQENQRNETELSVDDNRKRGKKTE